MDSKVLVVFYSKRGTTERLALALGVGAIQARALIRLRRLPPGDASAADVMTADERETFQRMARDYVMPRRDDFLWADVLILVSSTEGARDLIAYAEQLRGEEGVAARVAGVANSGDSRLSKPIYAAVAHAGLVVIPAPSTLDSTGARHAFGRQLVAFSRALKTAQT